MGQGSRDRKSARKGHNYEMLDYSTHDKSKPPTPDDYTGAHIKAGYDPDADRKYHESMKEVKAGFNKLKPREAGSSCDASHTYKHTDNGRGHKNLADKESSRE